MKVLIALFLIRLFCPSYDVIETVAIPDTYGTLFDIEGQVYSVYDRYHGNVHVIMERNDENDPTDDVVVAVIEKN